MFSVTASQQEAEQIPALPQALPILDLQAAQWSSVSFQIHKTPSEAFERELLEALLALLKIIAMKHPLSGSLRDAWQMV